MGKWMQTVWTTSSVIHITWVFNMDDSTCIA